VNPAAVLDARIRQIVAEELRSDLSPAMMMARQVIEAHQQEVAEFVDAKVAELVAYVSEQLTFMGGMVAGAKISQANPTGMELPEPLHYTTPESRAEVEEALADMRQPKVKPKKV
jgi:hypothetical protein